MSLPSMPVSAWPTFRTLVRAVVPAAEHLDDEGWLAVRRIVEAALAQRPETVRRQIALFLRVISVLAFLRHGRRFTDLPRRKAHRFLSGLERSRLLVIRRGFWGVRTLALMGYYARPEARGALGYRATRGGWRDRGGPQESWTERGVAGSPEAGVLTADGKEKAGA